MIEFWVGPLYFSRLEDILSDDYEDDDEEDDDDNIEIKESQGELTFFRDSHIYMCLYRDSR